MTISFRLNRQLQFASFVSRALFLSWTPFIFWATTVCWVAANVLTTTPASGQIVRIHPGLGIHVNAPYADIHIAPRRGSSRGELNRSTRLPRRRIWGGRFGARQLRDPNATLPSQGRLEPKAENSGPLGEDLDVGSSTITSSPELHQVPEVAETAQTELPIQQHRFNSEADQFLTTTELAQLDDTQLFRVLRDFSSRLNKNLAKFQTGPGWQHYLQLPENLPSRLDNQDNLQVKMDALLETLSRFEQVANNPDFHIIANQPSFVATLSVLREVNTRWDTQITNTPTTDIPQETLPTPKPMGKNQAPPGEHSILKR